MAAQTYNTIQVAVAQALSNAVGPAFTGVSDSFTVAFPQAISYAENRIYRDIVLLCERVTNATKQTIVASRSIDITSLNMIVVESVALLTPAGTTNPALGTRVPYDVSTLDLIDILWPQESITMSPLAAEWIGRYWAMIDPNTIAVMPTPDAIYNAYLTGMVAPTPLSFTNQTTYLSTNYPDLLECVIMVWMAGWLQRNYGASADDPKMATSWEAQYGTLLPGALNEEKRRRGMIPDMPPPPPKAE